MPHLKGQVLYLSFVSVAELYRWAVQHGWGQPRIDDLQRAIGAYNILGYDEPTAWGWARAVSIKGRPVAAGDAWIAAIALRHGLPLITHNRRHYEAIPGLAIISEA